MVSDIDGVKYIFGPVPSRRLGNSLGINNIPYKTCTYSCVYCQLGRTTNLTIERKTYSAPEKIIREIEYIMRKPVRIDYITFVPDGEPTLDKNLGKTAGMIKDKVSVPLAILTNGSLVWREDVHNELMLFDVVSLKIDGLGDVWRKINRPHPRLSIDTIVDAMIDFSSTYGGKILTETMLIHDLNTKPDILMGLASIVGRIRPHKAYLSIPIRPPAEPWVKPPTEEEIVMAYRIFADRLGEEKVELLITPEPPSFHPPEDPVEYILNVIAVHPLRIEYAIDILEKHTDKPQEVINHLINTGKICLVTYQGTTFITRRIPRGNIVTPSS